MLSSGRKMKRNHVTVLDEKFYYTVLSGWQMVSRWQFIHVIQQIVFLRWTERVGSQQKVQVIIFGDTFGQLCL